jgi:bile acid:Na+ symporter, BASS family
VQDNPLVEIGLPLVLAVLMVGIGLTLTVADFARERREPRAAVLGSIAQLLVMPGVAFLIALVLSLPPAIAVGLVVAAACPGGSTSNVIAYLGRANVALSIVLTVISSIAIIVTLPFWTGLALRWQPLGLDADVAVPVADTVGVLLAVVLIPVAVGMVVRVKAPDVAARLERIVGTLGAVVLVVLIIGIALSVRDQIVDLLIASGPAALLLSAAGVGVAFAVGSLGGVAVADRLTIAIELAVKNSTLGLLITLAVLGSEEVSFTVAVYGVVMYLTAIGLVVAGRRMGPAEATTGGPSTVVEPSPPAALHPPVDDARRNVAQVPPVPPVPPVPGAPRSPGSA